MHDGDQHCVMNGHDVEDARWRSYFRRLLDRRVYQSESSGLVVGGTDFHDHDTVAGDGSELRDDTMEAAANDDKDDDDGEDVTGDGGAGGDAVDVLRAAIKTGTFSLDSGVQMNQLDSHVPFVRQWHQFTDPFGMRKFAKDRGTLRIAEHHNEATLLAAVSLEADDVSLERYFGYIPPGSFREPGRMYRFSQRSKVTLASADDGTVTSGRGRILFVPCDSFRDAVETHNKEPRDAEAFLQRRELDAGDAQLMIYMGKDPLLPLYVYHIHAVVRDMYGAPEGTPTKPGVIRRIQRCAMPCDPDNVLWLLAYTIGMDRDELLHIAPTLFDDDMAALRQEDAASNSDVDRMRVYHAVWFALENAVQTAGVEMKELMQKNLRRFERHVETKRFFGGRTFELLSRYFSVSWLRTLELNMYHLLATQIYSDPTSVFFPGLKPWLTRKVPLKIKCGGGRDTRELVVIREEAIHVPGLSLASACGVILDMLCIKRFLVLADRGRNDAAKTTLPFPHTTKNRDVNIDVVRAVVTSFNGCIGEADCIRVCAYAMLWTKFYQENHMYLELSALTSALRDYPRTVEAACIMLGTSSAEAQRTFSVYKVLNALTQNEMALERSILSYTTESARSDVLSGTSREGADTIVDYERIDGTDAQDYDSGSDDEGGGRNKATEDAYADRSSVRYCARANKSLIEMVLETDGTDTTRIIGPRQSATARVKVLRANSRNVKVYITKLYEREGMMVYATSEFVKRSVGLHQSVGPIRMRCFQTYASVGSDRELTPEAAAKLNDIYNYACSEQIRALLCAHAGFPIVMLTGAGGAGKSEALRLLNDEIGVQRVLVTSFMGTHIEALMGKLDKNARGTTIHSIMNKHSMLCKNCDPMRYASAEKRFMFNQRTIKYYTRLMEAERDNEDNADLKLLNMQYTKCPFEDIEVLFIEEISVSNTELLVYLIYMLTTCAPNFRMIVCAGDINQLPPIQQDHVQRSLTDAFGMVRFHHVHRFEDRLLRKNADAIADGNYLDIQAQEIALGRVYEFMDTADVGGLSRSGSISKGGRRRAGAEETPDAPTDKYTSGVFKAKCDASGMREVAELLVYETSLTPYNSKFIVRTNEHAALLRNVVRWATLATAQAVAWGMDPHVFTACAYAPHRLRPILKCARSASAFRQMLVFSGPSSVLKKQHGVKSVANEAEMVNPWVAMTNGWSSQDIRGGRCRRVLYDRVMADGDLLSNNASVDDTNKTSAVRRRRDAANEKLLRTTLEPTRRIPTSAIIPLTHSGLVVGQMVQGTRNVPALQLANLRQMQLSAVLCVRVELFLDEWTTEYKALETVEQAHALMAEINRSSLRKSRSTRFEATSHEARLVIQDARRRARHAEMHGDYDQMDVASFRPRAPGDTIFVNSEGLEVPVFMLRSRDLDAESLQYYGNREWVLDQIQSHRARQRGAARQRELDAEIRAVTGRQNGDREIFDADMDAEEARELATAESTALDSDGEEELDEDDEAADAAPDAPFRHDWITADAWTYMFSAMATGGLTPTLVAQYIRAECTRRHEGRKTQCTLCSTAMNQDALYLDHLPEEIARQLFEVWGTNRQAVYQNFLHHISPKLLRYRVIRVQRTTKFPRDLQHGAFDPSCETHACRLLMLASGCTSRNSHKDRNRWIYCGVDTNTFDEALLNQLLRGEQVENGRTRDYQLTYLPYEGNMQSLVKDASVITTHAMQGAQAERIVLVTPPPKSRHNHRENVYSASTRPERAMFYLGDDDALQRAIVSPAPGRNSDLGKILRTLVYKPWIEPNIWVDLELAARKEIIENECYGAPPRDEEGEIDDVVTAFLRQPNMKQHEKRTAFLKACVAERDAFNEQQKRAKENPASTNTNSVGITRPPLNMPLNSKTLGSHWLDDPSSSDDDSSASATSGSDQMMADESSDHCDLSEFDLHLLPPDERPDVLDIHVALQVQRKKTAVSNTEAHGQQDVDNQVHLFNQLEAGGGDNDDPFGRTRKTPLQTPLMVSDHDDVLSSSSSGNVGLCDEAEDPNYEGELSLNWSSDSEADEPPPGDYKSDQSHDSDSECDEPAAKRRRRESCDLGSSSESESDVLILDVDDDAGGDEDVCQDGQSDSDDEGSMLFDITSDSDE